MTDGLTGWNSIVETEVDWEFFHDCYLLNNSYIAGRHGACWRLYTKDGYPLTRQSHALRIESFGKLISELGANELEYELSDLMDDYNLKKKWVQSIVKAQMEKKVVV